MGRFLAVDWFLGIYESFLVCVLGRLLTWGGFISSLVLFWAGC